MAVDVKEQSTSDKQSEQQDVQDKQDAVTDKMLEGLDLPEVEEINEDGGDVKTKIDLKELNEEESEEEEVEDVEDSDEEEEEVVSKSKFQKRLDSEVARRKVLEAKVSELETAPKKDSRSEKLEAMSDSELKSMKVQARDKWFDAKKDGDVELARQYQELEGELDDIIKAAPDKFQKAQAKAYSSAANDIMSDSKYENIDFDKSSEEIKNIANDIYSKYKDLQSLKTGQATALKMAVDHFKESQKFTKGKSKQKELKQKNLKLKRKTSLDSSSIKGNVNKSSLKTKYDNAKKTNSFYDKLDYASEIIDVDRYLPAEHR